MNVVWVDDQRIALLAQRFRGHKHATDVLSFPANSPQGLWGEIAVSLDTARQQANERSVPVAHELVLLVLHGLLHLAGLNDTNLTAWRRMRSAEFQHMMRIL